MGTTSSKAKRKQRKLNKASPKPKKHMKNDAIVQTYEEPLVVVSDKPVEQKKPPISEERTTNPSGSSIDKSKKGSRREPPKDRPETTTGSRLKIVNNTKDNEFSPTITENPDHPTALNSNSNSNSNQSTTTPTTKNLLAPTAPTITKSNGGSTSSTDRKLLGRLLCGSFSDRGKRKKNEDCIVCLPVLENDPDAAVFAVYDGHGGRKAAAYCKEYLHVNITKQQSYPHNLPDAVLKGFMETDKKYHADVDDGGTTVLLTLIRRISRSNTRNLPCNSNSRNGSDDDSSSSYTPSNSDSDYSTSEEEDSRSVSRSRSRSRSGSGTGTSSSSESFSEEDDCKMAGKTPTINATGGRDLSNEEESERYMMLIANAGDCRAVGGVCRKTPTASTIAANRRSNMIAIPLSRDHKPSFVEEKKRIEASGHTVDVNTFQRRDEKSNNPLNIHRVDGLLSVSRSIGDWGFKDRSDLPPDAQAVSAIPDIIQIPLWPSASSANLSPKMSSEFEKLAQEDILAGGNPEIPSGLIPETYFYRFVILACDGLWDVLSNKDAVDFVAEKLDAIETSSSVDDRGIGHEDISRICEELVAYSISKDATDNVSAVIIVFQQ